MPPLPHSQKIRDYLAATLDPAAAACTGDAIDTLISLWRIRVGAQHADARHKAVDAANTVREIGLAFPPVSWEHAWTHVAWLAKGALELGDVTVENVRERIWARLTADRFILGPTLALSSADAVV